MKCYRLAVVTTRHCSNSYHFVIAVWSEKQAESPGVKYWKIIADNLSKAGWSWGCASAVDSEGRTIWIVDAHRAATESVSLCVREAGGPALATTES
jgi:hypothetical protein